ncbi:MAG: hypothetical protein PHT84_02415 [Candidatus Pacebacteria bacterium]|jgi:hypothetical protein|nr:hypothetical protein [Candidatus Paceibacterota bacterium]
MALGQSFPVSDYYKDQILDAETVSRAGGWWTAVLLIQDPKTQKPFVAVYRWQLHDDTWKTRKSISFKSKKQIDAVLVVLAKMSSRLGESPDE